MSDSKKMGLECPICKGIFESDELTIHVNLHFEEESISKKCDYPGCFAVINESQLDDHLLAHQVCCSDDNNEDDKLNDSTLARIIQEEQNVPGPSHKSDEEFAKTLQREDDKKLEEESYKNLKEKFGMTDTKDGFVKQFEKEMAKKVGGKFSVADYYEMKSNVHTSLISGYDSCNTRTQGIIEHLKTSRKLEPGVKQYFSVDTDHFSVDIGDKGWGCGYRNIQMIFSSLLNNVRYRKHLSTVAKVPSVTNLQVLIEKSWRNGFDVAGCQQLGGSLQGSRKWIGTTEAAALFSWLKLKAKIVDFHKPTSVDGMHPELFNWIHNYFETRNRDNSTVPAFPLYIQHQGHSRLCVGCEVGNDNSAYPVTLIMFDPGISRSKMESLLKSKDICKHLKLVKKSLKQMKHQQFQLLYIDGFYNDDVELEESKVIKSQRIPP